ncbi:MAG: 16S rRNA (guanine(966)-N(2))-methyltransferase RsmD [Flavobacteriales bacterium]|nr:16S rRNA (guanine(966)-N(2))-methyltransferase RsmD [Flavobacteriales bacterium]
MRIIGGTAKGRRFAPPKSFDSRPTTDFAREGLFNVLTHQLDFDDITILDLCCGSGAISYEFASRGAKKVISVDRNSDCIRFISKNAETFRLPQIKAVRADVQTYLKKSKLKFDIIIADPPFSMDVLENWYQLILDNQLLNEGGMVILEHEERSSYSHLSGFLESRKYGQVVFSLFQPMNDE